MSEYEVVVGIEIHVQLDTKTKMFCDCEISHSPHDEPNSHTCQICMGFPGTLPVLNEKAIEKGVLLAKALGCKLNPTSFWDRKQYFYPDLTKGYQITQYEKPFAEGGGLEFPVEIEGKVEFKKVILERIHLEEDTGKSFHGGEDTFLDFNRCGVPLVEIVTTPDIVSDPQHAGVVAKAFLEELQFILQNEKFEGSDEVGVGRAKLEEGQMRFDINISVRKSGGELGVKQEIKNLNSLASVKVSIDMQAKKQIDIIESGGTVEQSTWNFDEKKNDTVMLRSKEEAHDYRYFREPDLPELVLDGELINKKVFGIALEKKQIILPPLNAPKAFLARKLLSYPSKIVVDYLLEILDRLNLLVEVNEKDFSNIVRNIIYYQVLNYYLEKDEKSFLNLFEDKREIFIDGFVFLLKKIEIEKVVSPQKFIEASKRMIEKVVHPKEFINDYLQVSDDSQLEAWADEAISENPNQVAEYKAGKEPLIMFFVGQVMKKSQSKADGEKVKEILQKRLRD